jgi:transcription antitermination factor NusG
MAKAWYVIECYDGKDAFVRLTLAAAGFHVWRPVREVRVTSRWNGKPRKSNSREVKYVPRFGRYLFVCVEMNDSVRSAICETKGVRAWLCMAGTNEPAQVPSALIEFYQTKVAERLETETNLRKGDAVCISAGPFKDHCGRVRVIDKRGVVTVEIDLFGRPTPIIIEVGHVYPVEQGRRPPIGDSRKSA